MGAIVKVPICHVCIAIAECDYSEQNRPESHKSEEMTLIRDIAESSPFKLNRHEILCVDPLRCD
ncbi:hypothetical protein ANRL4_04086 [Anaerolineae bacterium]|nr:hypothetical protein ANRL4_04086 [Anaerolineae bacterium]